MSLPIFKVFAQNIPSFAPGIWQRVFLNGTSDERLLWSVCIRPIYDLSEKKCFPSKTLTCCHLQKFLWENFVLCLLDEHESLWIRQIRKMLCILDVIKRILSNSCGNLFFPENSDLDYYLTSIFNFNVHFFFVLTDNLIISVRKC